MQKRLGVLLGEYDSGQSLSQVSSWSNNLSAGAASFQTTNTHSSSKSLSLPIDVGVTGYYSYNYAQIPDLYDRWQTDVTTHKAYTAFWARIDTAANSGQIVASVYSSQTIIAHSNSLQRYDLETFVTSETGYELKFSVSGTVSGAFIFYLDDVTSTIDIVDLSTDWGFKNSEKIDRADHNTLSGQQGIYRWNANKNWDVPVRYLCDSEANTLNTWWQSARNCLYIDTTSDSSQNFIVRVTNTERPFQGLQQPYHYLWQGTLNLSAVSDSLEF